MWLAVAEKCTETNNDGSIAVLIFLIVGSVFAVIAILADPGNW
jgi:hypothetical protein